MRSLHISQRNSGLALIGDLPWGSHFGLFYRTAQDLLELLAPYFQAGLENNEACVWVLSESLTRPDAEEALKKSIPQLEQYFQRGQLEFVSESQWCAGDGKFESLIISWLDQAILRGFDGLRFACGATPEKRGGKVFTRLGAEAISRCHVIGAYAYPRDQFDALRLMEVVKNHHLALVRNGGRWEVIASSEAQLVRDNLRQSEETLQSLFSNMTEGFAYHRIVLDGEGKPCDFIFLELNEAFERLTGLKRDAILGQRVTEALPGIERDPTDWIGKYGNVALTGTPAQFESFFDPLKKWYAVSVFSPHKGFFAVTFTDITERRQAEEALRVSEQRVRLKLDSILSPEGDIGNLELADLIDVPAIQSLMDQFHEFSRIPMAIIDLKGRVLVGVGWSEICTRFHRVNSESCCYCIESDTQLTTGVAPGEFRLYKCKNHMWDVATPIMVGGQHVGNLFTGQFFFEGEPLDRELFRAQARQYGFNEAAYLHALEAVPRLSHETLNTGMAFFMKIAHMISQLSYSNIKLARSLAEYDALTKELARSNQDLEQFAYVASHDLQEPLRMVTGFVELLREEHQGRLGAQADTYIHYAVDGARRMQILIDDLLAYSRVSTRGAEFTPTDSGEALEQALASLQVAIGESGAVITHGPLPTVNADGRQLAQVFQNLIGNAVKFHAAATPRVHVEARREETHWLFSIQDNGIGIDPEFKDRIFLIFQRLHTRQKYPGTGIGLAICKKIIDRHGGRIWLDSIPEEGARFCFTIPV